MDYFKTVGELGLGSRLKRLSDVFMNEVKAAYTAEGIKFEPRWFPLFSLLLQKREVVVTLAAQQLNLTHPHISLLAKEMAKAKLLAFRPNPQDARSRVLTLTEKGCALAQQVEFLWQDIRAAVQSVLEEVDPQFLARVEKMENALESKPFLARVKKASKERAVRTCRILDYGSNLKSHFESLNREWIESHFSIESHDTKYFSNPEKEILKRGGEVLFAELEGKIVGTCALLHENGKYELAKLAVTECAKGKGIGEVLSKEIIKRAKKRGAKSLSLTTNSGLIPAVKLYEKLGFKEISRGQHTKFKRVNLIMEKVL